MVLPALGCKRCIALLGKLSAVSMTEAPGITGADSAKTCEGGVAAANTEPKTVQDLWERRVFRREGG